MSSTYVPFPEYNHPTWIAGVITVFIVLVAFVVFVVGLIIWWYRRRSKRDDQQNRRHRDGAPSKSISTGIMRYDHVFVVQ